MHRKLPEFLLLVFFLLVIASFPDSSVTALDQASRNGPRRLLLSFKETPRGTNRTYDCSVSGPCVSCQYSEKNDDQYMCSETGYRIPFKCVEIKDEVKAEDGKKHQDGRSALEISSDDAIPHVTLYETAVRKHRNLRSDTPATQGVSQTYITYRSCLPTANEEKLSVIGFEGIVFCLLIMSGSAVYFRRKRSATMPGVGAGRFQTNSRF
ncbi:hypothetical protein K2173_006339 [Erythroxylum novogranatense]|uniref:Uncharacterized protein n=1 Tax=Erythroxylum novogranatense TaxID=1862640 RepID=A0AAV8U667_9ROSI|nr:hypothetical protein K2173_006339 [Erythroxylum novogranatense]